MPLLTWPARATSPRNRWVSPQWLINCHYFVHICCVRFWIGVEQIKQTGKTFSLIKREQRHRGGQYKWLQLEMEEALAQRIRPLNLEGMDTDQLKDRVQVLSIWYFDLLYFFYLLFCQLFVALHERNIFCCRSTGEPTQVWRERRHNWREGLWAIFIDLF